MGPVVRVGVTGFLMTTTLFGGLSQRDLLHREHFQVEVVVEKSVSSRVALYTGFGGAAHVVPGVAYAVGPGLLPVGLRVQLGRGWDVAAAGGTWCFSTRIPVPGSRKIVFTGQLDIGKRIRGWRVGVSFLHLSNAMRGEVNPGYNTVGVSLSRSIGSGR